MGEFLVHVQGVAVEAGLATDVANDRLFSMAEAYVVRQVTLDLELLAAGLAGELEVVRVFASDVYLQLVLVLVLVIALAAIEQFRLRVAATRSRLSVFSLDVRVQRRLLAGLKTALVACVHLTDVFHLMPTFVRVQCALLRARKVAQIATFSDASLAGSFRDISSDRDYSLAAVLRVHFFFDYQIRIFVRHQGGLLGRRVVALHHPASLLCARVGWFLLRLGMIPRQVGRQSRASLTLEVAHIANETRRVLAPVLTCMPV